MVIVVPVVAVIQEFKKKEKIAITQEHKKLTSKRNLRNSKAKKISRFQH
jgi:hypothetical protein